ncbi:MAG: GIY-YIG nuclease family protein [bacterium]
MGYTNNFNRRFQQHNNGLVRSTKYRTPFKLLFKEEFKEAYKAKKTRIMVEKWRW